MKKRTYGTGYLRSRGKNTWQIMYRIPGEESRRTETITAPNRRAAESEMHKRIENPTSLSKTDCASPTLGMSFALHLASLRRDGARDRANVELKMRKHLYPRFESLPVKQFTALHGIRYIEERLSAGAKPSTVNRETSALRQSLKLARKQGWIDSVPEIEHLSEKNNRRKGFFEFEDYERMLSLLPPHQHMLLCFACCTGVRKSELLSLRWEWLDRQSMLFAVPGEFCKNGEPHLIPVYGPMVSFLSSAWESRNPSCPYIFQYQGKQLRNIRTAWDKARERAGAHYLFHDLRRTAARFMERALIPRSVAKSIGGWKTDEMWNRYLVGSERDTIQAGKVMEIYFSSGSKIGAKLASSNVTHEIIEIPRTEAKLLD